MATNNSTNRLIPAKNLIVGGDFNSNPWQRNTSVTGVSNNEYVADRFKSSFTSAAVCDVQRTADSPTQAEAGIYSGFCHETIVTTSDAAIAAGDYFNTIQNIEGYNFTAIAEEEFIFSFWIKSNVTGTMCVAFRNSGLDRSFVSEITIDSSATWEKKTVAVSASPSAGTWDYTTGVGLSVSFTLAAGTTYQTTADAWQTGDYLATSSQTNFLATNSNYVRIALIQLEKGNLATEFESRAIQDELNLCQRYFYKTYAQGTSIGSLDDYGSIEYISKSAGVSTYGTYTSFPVTMRTRPTFTGYSTGVGSSSNWYNAALTAASGASSFPRGDSSGVYVRNAQAAGDGADNAIRIHITADAEL